MKIGEGVSVGISSIGRNKLRSFLTMLGIIIGVAAVIGMVAVGEGANTLILQELEKLGGTNLFVIQRLDWIRKGDRWVRNTSSEYITLEDAYAILERCPSVTVMNPEIMTGAHIAYQDRDKYTLMEATTPGFSAAQEWYLDFGRFISDSDLSNWDKIVVIGMKIWRDFFGDTNPIGQEIKINRQRFRVVGVMEEKGPMFGGDWDRDEQILIPLTTAQKRFQGNDRVNVLWCKAKDYRLVERAVEEARIVLMQRHKGEEFFQIDSAKQFLESVAKVSSVIKAMLGGIAAIALLVGGVGIMNIMLVSVTERTREIGLRKALGAKRRDILFQFIIEAVVMCVVGGVLGIAAGFLIGAGMAQIINTFVFKGANWPATVSFSSVLMGLGFSALIGLFFGIYPAQKAARLQPVEALRYE